MISAGIDETLASERLREASCRRTSVLQQGPGSCSELMFSTLCYQICQACRIFRANNEIACRLYTTCTPWDRLRFVVQSTHNCSTRSCENGYPENKHSSGDYLTTGLRVSRRYLLRRKRDWFRGLSECCHLSFGDLDVSRPCFSSQTGD